MDVEVTDSELFHERRAGALHSAVFGTVRAWDGVERGTVAGCPAFLVDGSSFAVVSDGGLALSGLSEADSERLRVRWSALTFDPGDRSADEGGITTDGRCVQSDGGRDQWPLVPVGGNDLVLLRPFLRLSYDGARRRSAGARTAD
ncbi:hypothetical protein ACFPYI_08180 [Halomarina salina]|uniref:Uncharacterized protein n=1 Tax=Halomarina salina TaxID=1872699 RepID=A0ABD5RL12_9EURY|nr:hypothetical protein [Halomarina salina]